MPLALIVGLVVSVVISGALSVQLWRTRAPRWKRLLWTPVLFLPVLGWVFYGGFFDAPSAQLPGAQANENRDTWTGG